MKHLKVSKLGDVILKETSGIRPIDLARSLECSVTFLNYLIRGDRRLTVPMAKRLASVSKRSPREWLELQWGELG